MKFKDLKLSKTILETLEGMGFEKPTPIQSQLIPVGLDGSDVIGQAHTGTGKTAAFGIPIIEQVKPGDDLQALILAPSRELATQIYKEMIKLSKNQKLKITNIIGGVSYVIQEKDLRKKPNIIIATPGRLIDTYEKKRLDFSKIAFFTLDEADEMINFGFKKQLEQISVALPKERQTFFLTATFNKKTKTLAHKILKTPTEIIVSEGLSTSDRVEQHYIITKEKAKLKTLVHMMQIKNPKSTIIFGRTRRRVDELSTALKELGYKVAGIQGDMRQSDRTRALQNFRDERINIIVGTDVVARGIDVEHVDLVVNFDMPEEPEIYTHRIGRTGRAGKDGIAVSFIKPSEVDYLFEVMKKTNAKINEMKSPTDADLIAVKNKELDDRVKDIFNKGKEKYKKVGQQIAKNYSKEELGIIIASALIGEKKSAYDIQLTGEKGVFKKKGGSSFRNNRGGGSQNRKRGGYSSRNSSNGRSSSNRRSSSNGRSDSGRSRSRRER